MSRIKINQLPEDSSELNELKYCETSNIIGGAGDISSQDMLNNAVQEALFRSDVSQNSNTGVRASIAPKKQSIKQSNL